MATIQDVFESGEFEIDFTATPRTGANKLLVQLQYNVISTGFIQDSLEATDPDIQDIY